MGRNVAALLCSEGCYDTDSPSQDDYAHIQSLFIFEKCEGEKDGLSIFINPSPHDRLSWLSKLNILRKFKKRKKPQKPTGTRCLIDAGVCY